MEYGSNAKWVTAVLLMSHKVKVPININEAVF